MHLWMDSRRGKNKQTKLVGLNILIKGELLKSLFRLKRPDIKDCAPVLLFTV